MGYSECLNAEVFSLYNEFKKLFNCAEKEWYLVCPMSQMALISGPVFSPNGEILFFF